MKRALLLAWLVALLPLPALGAGESYPSTLVDQGCTDSYSVPAAASESNLVIEPSTQTSGSADGTCDHDNRILTGAITADTTFGPLRGERCLYIFADGNTVTGGDTKWRISVQAKQPHDAVLQTIHTFAEATAAADDILLVADMTAAEGGSVTAVADMHLPDTWYLLLDLNTATSWTGEISMVTCN